MLKLILDRLALAALTLFIVSVIVFLAIEALPSDMASAYLGRDATPQSLAVSREEFGLNRPMLTRYFEWFSGIIQGDLGESLARRKPITELIRYRLRNTVALAAIASLVGIPIAVVMGILAGLTRDRLPDLVVSTVSIAAMTLPEFVVGTFLVYFFTFQLELFPAVVTVASDAPLSQLIPNMLLPIMTLTCVMIAHILRLIRTSLIDVMLSDYVIMAQLKGVPTWRVVLRHALPNAMLPTINIIALTVAWLLGGAVIIESMFNFPGIGTLMLSGISGRDLMLVQALAMILATVYVLVNLAADLITLLLNPRLRAAKVG